MSKFGFVSEGKTKSFNYVKTTSETVVVFIYFAKIFEPNNSDLLTNPFLPLSFVVESDLRNRLKKLSIEGLFNLNFTGVSLNIELTHSYKEICDVLFH